MGQSAIKHCPVCNKPMVFALPSGGGRRAFRCTDCDQPDPIESEVAKGWLRGELGQPSDPDGQAKAGNDGHEGKT